MGGERAVALRDAGQRARFQRRVMKRRIEPVS